jgi:hypothetical protein
MRFLIDVITYTLAIAAVIMGALVLAHLVMGAAHEENSRIS